MHQSRASLRKIPLSLITRFPHCSSLWTTQDLVTIGVFSAVIKASTVLVAMMGGGMNPLSLLAKNCLFAMLMVVVLHKVPRPGALLLVVGVNALVSLLLMGQGILSLLGGVLAGLLAESSIRLAGGYQKTAAIVVGIFLFEIINKILSVGIVALVMREQWGLVLTIALFVGIGALGTPLGLFFGMRFLKELRHAGILVH